MNVALDNAYKQLALNNTMFGEGDSYCSFDLFRPFKRLRSTAEEYGVMINSPDIAKKNGNLDALIQCDLPFLGSKSSIPDLSILILIEPHLIRPDNWDWINHLTYNRICTWNIEWTRDCGYDFITPFTCDSEEIDLDQLNEESFHQRKLIVAVSGNKRSQSSGELYSLRERDYGWLFRNHPTEFSLAGVGWHESQFGRVISPTSDKRSFLRQGKFAIAYENTENAPGYISEKLFDCFRANTVPIYCGDPQSIDLIPSDCFIKRNSFNNLSQLVDYLEAMSYTTWLSHLENFKNFIESPSGYKFTTTNFTKSIMTMLDRSRP